MRPDTVVTALALFSLVTHVALMGAFHVLVRRRRGGSALCHGDILKRPTQADRLEEPGTLAGAPTRSVRRARQIVSVLKPLAGHDDDLEANLESFAALTDYQYEIVFGVASARDSALPVARAFIAKHPDVDARIVFTDPDAATNPKVAQLIGLAARAKGRVLVTSDSNVRVAPDYLVHLLRPLADPRCGLVTNLFAGTGERTLGAALENLQLAAVITPSVVLSMLGTSITVGKSMAIRRRDLELLGGFEAFGDVLAEDLMIGRRVSELGLRIATSFAAVENRNVVGSVMRTFDRHARWAKMRRAILPQFFALEPLFVPAFMALVAALVAPSRTTLALLCASIIVQTITAHAAAWTVRGRPLPWRYAPLEIVRIFLMLACWANAWMKRTVTWRGHAFAIGTGSTITPLAAPSPYVDGTASKSSSASKMWAA
jgi:ceramide glucosyltransferase